MTDFSHILLVSDYDRTMTAFDGTIPQANLDAIAEFTDRGGVFTIATGRSRPMFRKPVEQLPISVPVILANGGALWEPDTDRVTVFHQLSDEAMAAVRDITNQFPHLRLELQGLDYHRCMGYDAIRDAYLARYGLEPNYGGWDDLQDLMSVACLYAPFQKAAHARPEDTTPEEEAPFEAIEALVAERYSHLLEAVRSMPRMIELLPKGCGKGNAARQLAQQLGRSTLLCVGDAPNDLDMLDKADEAFYPTSAESSLFHRGYTPLPVSCQEGTIAALVELLKQR